MSEKANKILYIVLSLLLAVVFWLFVDAAQENTITREFAGIPVEFIGAEDTLPSRGLMLAGGEDATVTVKLRGPRLVISNLRTKDLRAEVNLTDINAVGPYSKTYQVITPDNVNDGDITVERKTPGTLTVRVTTLYAKEVPVDVNVVGGVSDPYLYTAEAIVSEPAALTLSGLQDSVDEVASARVTVDITGADGTIQQDYEYELLDSEGNVIEDPDVRVSDQRVNVTVPVYMMKELPLVIKYKEAPGSRKANTECTLEPNTITVAGDPLSLAAIDEIVLGELDLSAYYTDYDDDLDIKLPAGCENVSGYKTTHLTVKYKGLETRGFTVTNISPIGLSESQRFDRVTTAVDVLLRGPAEDLAQVTEEDVRIVVDLREVATDGTVHSGAIVYVDGYSEVGAVGTYTVTGKIISS